MRLHTQRPCGVNNGRWHGDHQIKLRNQRRRVVVVVGLASPFPVMHRKAGRCYFLARVFVLQANARRIDGFDDLPECFEAHRTR